MYNVLRIIYQIFSEDAYIVPLLFFFFFVVVFSFTAGVSAGASTGASQPPITSWAVPKMGQEQRDFADMRFVIWCCINLRPQQMRLDEGFKLFVGTLNAQYVDTTMSGSTFNKALDTLYDRVKGSLVDDLRSLREECLGMGYSGAFLGAQLDLTTVAGEEYITFSVSYVKKGSSEVSRASLATRAFPGSHTADDIKPWIEAVRLILSFYAF